jgi:hypothetical protein
MAPQSTHDWSSPMSSLKTNLVVSASFGVIAIVGTIVSSQYAAAQPPGPADGMAVRIVSPLPVPVTGNTTVSGTVSAQQSGTWTVTLDTTSANPVTVKPAAPITSGGQGDFMATGATHNYVASSTASALSILFTGGAEELILFSGDSMVGRFVGGASGVNMALNRPISFTKASCFGAPNGRCTFGWIGNAP